ncbi:MAG: cyanophycinase [Flavobacteriales bacterium]|nr:cyanophycinase [Flavobacteriales bacterium]
MSSHSKPRGVLVPIGGGEDRGEETAPALPFEKKGVLKHVLDKAKGAQSKVVLVTSASSIPKEVSEAYRAGFKRLGCENLVHYHMVEKAECNEETLLKDFAEADVVMFSGGNQSKLPLRIRKTKLHQLLKERYWNDTLVIAGTSAGAMAMSEFMVAGGSASEAFVKGAVHMRTGLGFIPELIIDTHFVRRGRFGRLAEAVAIHPQCVGIGLAENTGVIIEDGDHFTVIGSGMAILMDPRSVKHNNHSILKEGTLMSMTNLTTHFLSNGDKFRLSDHSTEVLPMGQSFI